jgi:hypothetical protein
MRPNWRTNRRDAHRSHVRDRKPAGITFWQRQGFEIVGPIDGKRENQYYLMRRYRSI